jgi:MYXO-CTERM domain-containing protein
VPSGKTNVPSKGKYELEVAFSPDADGPASATITVKSNDPDSPEQTFKIGANGADIESDDGESTGSKKGQKPGEGVRGLEPIESDGCSAAPAGTHHGTSGAAAALGLGLAVALASRRRRK